MKFNYKRNDVDITFELHEDSSVDEVLEEFQNFLRACGYVIEYNKVLDLVDIDDVDMLVDVAERRG